MSVIMNAIAEMSTDREIVHVYVHYGGSSVQISQLPLVNPRDDEDRVLRDNGWNRVSSWVPKDQKTFTSKLRRWAP